MRLSPLMITLLIILAVLIVVLIVLYFWGKKLQKRQDESQAQMEATKQTVQIFVIDKKMLPLKQSGLPQIVIDQTPKLMRRSKMPIVKARVQGRIMTLVADQKVWMSRRSAANLKRRPRRKSGISVLKRADPSYNIYYQGR